MSGYYFTTLIKPSTLRSLMLNRVPLKILDASYTLPGTSGDPKQEHFKTRIPGSLFFEIDDIADKTSKYPHMMPKSQVFQSNMRRLGIKNDDSLVVIYDSKGIISSPRAWFTFLAFNRNNIAVLDGGLKKWVSEGHPTESGEYDSNKIRGDDSLNYDYFFNQNLVKSFDDVKSISEDIKKNENSKFQILDARSEGRFKGTDPEPRPGLRSGSIPGSLNCFFKRVTKDDGTMREPLELRKMFEEIGVRFDESTQVVNSCGSGLTACINILALKVAGKKNLALYDGSWMEWGSLVLN